MSSNITYDDSTITSTTPDKYEAILIYYVHENNVHEGGLYDKHYQVWAPYDGENFDAFVDLAYFTLETLMDEKQ
ncbi:unnamed protein product [Rotaria sp. Silwood2]|nr:unnamed protein product [Rotaria sp. Silwood2]CAF4382405.1 unnamed protein product [Rotaria sp. Silwood2]